MTIPEAGDREVMGWRADSECLKVHPKTMFPTPIHKDLVQQAIDVCNRCPVIEQCRVVSVNEPFGVWAGVLRGGSKQIRDNERRANAKKVDREERNRLKAERSRLETERIMAENVRKRAAMDAADRLAAEEQDKANADVEEWLGRMQKHGMERERAERLRQVHEDYEAALRRTQARRGITA